MAGFITTLITFAAGTAAAFGILFGAFFAISFAIRREDVTGTLTGHAPSRACRSARPHPVAPGPLGIGRAAAATGDRVTILRFPRRVSAALA